MRANIDSELDALSSRLTTRKAAAQQATARKAAGHRAATATKPEKRPRQKPVRSAPVEALIAEHCAAHGLNAEDVLKGFRIGVGVLSGHLAQHQCVLVDGLGKFRWRPWKSRLGYNRYTGKQVVIPASDRLKFIPDDALQQGYSPTEEDDG
jgi:nucleoid DNA-binding protein